MTNVDLQSVNSGIGRYATLYLRIAFAAAFLTSVTDRLGMWTVWHSKRGWGDMTYFIAYAASSIPGSRRRSFLR